MNRGRAALLRVLTRTRVEYVAARCEVTRSAVYNWLAGRRRPNVKARRALLSSYRIPFDDWDKPAPSTVDVNG